MHLGAAQRQRVLSDSPILSNWESFLRIEKNKDELFCYLSESMRHYDTKGKVLVSTLGDSVITAGHYITNTESLVPCTHEEADTQIILHTAHCAQQGYKRISIRTVDTDVVVLAVGHFQSLYINTYIHM